MKPRDGKTGVKPTKTAAFDVGAFEARQVDETNVFRLAVNPLHSTSVTILWISA